jgi:hypothetical protein
MNSNALSRQAIRLAQREAKKRGRVLTKEEILKLHVQTVCWWARLVFAGMGIAVFAVASCCHYANGPLWLSVPMGLLGLALTGFGVLGKKQTVERKLKKISRADMADAFLGSVIDQLF